MTVEDRSILIGLIGTGIDGSLSPAMHEHEADCQGLRYIYKRIDLDKINLDSSALPELLTYAERMGFTGLNITHPCKQEVIPFLHELSDDAETIGAVNTVLFKDGKRIGYNTDGKAFVDGLLENHPDVALESIALVGAGGAGAAIAHSLLGSVDTFLFIIDEKERRAVELADKVGKIYGPGKVQTAGKLADIIDEADGVINATPVGMKHCPGSVVEKSLLRPDLWVADIVYFPLETELLAASRSCGCPTMDGGEMAIRQAAAAFEIFTGRKAQLARMRENFRALAGGKEATQSRAAASSD